MRPVMPAMPMRVVMLWMFPKSGPETAKCGVLPCPAALALWAPPSADWPPRREPSGGQVFQHHRGGLLTDHDAGRIGVAGDDRRHDRRVGDPQSAMPWTRRRGSTTEFVPVPMAQVLLGWWLETPVWRMNAAMSSSDVAAGPGAISSATYGRSAGCSAMRRASRMPVTTARMSYSVRRKSNRIDGRRQRVGAGQPHRAAPVGLQVHRAQGEAREAVRDDAVLAALQRAPFHQVDLQVGPLQPRVGAGEQRRHGCRCSPSGRSGTGRSECPPRSCAARSSPDRSE